MVSCECTLKSFRTFDNNEWILKPELFVSFFPPRFSFIVEIKIVITVEIIVEIKIIFTKKKVLYSIPIACHVWIFEGRAPLSSIHGCNECIMKAAIDETSN